jgi:hypothetical protein
LKAVVAPETGGDPMSDVKWLRKSTRNIARILTSRRLPISHSTAGRRLRRLRYSLRSNRKRLSLRPSPDREKQFQKLTRIRKDYERRALPIVSVDAKKRELIGPFKNAGKEWRSDFRDVSTYDFPSDANAIAIPYGIYDPARDEGFVVVGTSRNTAAFAASSIRKWWISRGSKIYEGATELLILADGGGSNAQRVAAWKIELARLATEFGLRIRVAHYPTGASKWNPVEHRLFAPISINWAGRPLVDHKTIIGLISSTRLGSGARCTARLDLTRYLTQKEFAALHGHSERVVIPPNVLRVDPVLPKWNYTVYPQAVSS